MPRWEISDGKKGEKSALHYLASFPLTWRLGRFRLNAEGLRSNPCAKGASEWREEAGSSTALSCYHMLNAAVVGVSLLN